VYKPALKGDIKPSDIFRVLKYKWEFKKNNPNYFDPYGTMIFCGSQGYGKTLSAVQYVLSVLRDYPYAILCTNVKMKSRPFNSRLAKDESSGSYVVCCNADGSVVTEQTILSGRHKFVTVEYDGLDCLKWIENGQQGVIFLIDEMHLEMNSLESKNVDIEVMVEISQQRKQRKHIVATSQRYMRLAKPLREQIRDVVLCQNYYGLFQFNKLIDGESATENNGKLECEVRSRAFWTISPDMYAEYDTYAKMRRYKDEWQGRSRIEIYHDTQRVEVLA
jgi:hypothetical protein